MLESIMVTMKPWISGKIIDYGKWLILSFEDFVKLTKAHNELN
jgi:hypothetical protein